MYTCTHILQRPPKVNYSGVLAQFRASEPIPLLKAYSCSVEIELEFYNFAVQACIRKYNRRNSHSVLSTPTGREIIIIICMYIMTMSTVGTMPDHVHVHVHVWSIECRGFESHLR